MPPDMYLRPPKDSIKEQDKRLFSDFEQLSLDDILENRGQKIRSRV